MKYMAYIRDRDGVIKDQLIGEVIADTAHAAEEKAKKKIASLLKRHQTGKLHVVVRQS